MNIEAMLDNDIIGGVTTYKNAPDRQSIRVFAEAFRRTKPQGEANTRRSVGGENDSPSRQLGRYVKEMGTFTACFKVMMIYRRDRYGRGGDHISFLEQGYAAVRFTETHEDYTHQHQTVKMVDGKRYGSPQFVDFEYVANATRVNLIGLAISLWLRPKPKNVGIVTAGLPTTVLKWDANTGCVFAGKVVWRDTTAPFWTNSKFVGNVYDLYRERNVEG
jgi:hypothetical protein